MENKVQAYPNLDVSGPSSSTDNAVARWNGTSGKSLQDSLASIDDSGNLVLVGDLTVDTINSGVNLSITSGLLLSGSLDVGGDITVAGSVDGRDVGNLGPIANNQQRLFKAVLTDSASFLTIGNTAYFCYIGYTLAAVTPIKAVVQCTVAGTSTQTAELGLFSTPGPPGTGNQTLTKIEATGTITSLLVANEIVNTSNFSTSVPFGTHLWVGFRADMAGTEPTMRGVSGMQDRLNVLTTAAAGALTASSTFAGVVPAFSTARNVRADATLDLQNRCTVSLANGHRTDTITELLPLIGMALNRILSLIMFVAMLSWSKMSP